jgi:hypothetical protein
MPTLSRLKQVVLHRYLTQPVRVLFPPDIDLLSICASCFDENELEDRCGVHGDVSFETRIFVASGVLAFAPAQQHPIMEKFSDKIIAKYRGTSREQLRNKKQSPNRRRARMREKLATW